MKAKIIITKKAFSLIELSIVLLIVGIIIAGVTQSSRMVGAFRVSSARTLTNSSPVSSIANVVMWVETTAEESFIKSEAENGRTISLWSDINPTSTSKNSPYQDTAENQPTYVTNCINNLPCLRFDGATSAMSFDGSVLTNTDYTIIIVEQRRAAGDLNFILGGSEVDRNLMLTIGYRYSDRMSFGYYDNDYIATIPTYSGQTNPVIHSFVFDNVARFYYFNGASTALSESEFSGYHGASDPLLSYGGAYIGLLNINSGFYYSGDIAEIILINRAISQEERRSIETYLGKKWKINVS